MTHVTGNGIGAGSASGDAPALVILTGPSAGRRIGLGSEIVLGRSTINDHRAAERHATVRPHDGGFELKDLGSRNGTMVNGTRIEGLTELAYGDVVTLGQTTMVVELAEATGSEATAVLAVPQR